MNEPQTPSNGELEFMAMNCPHCGVGVDFLVDLAGTVQGCPSCTRSLVLPRKTGDPASTVPLPMEGSKVRLRRLGLADVQDLTVLWEWEEEEVADWLNQHGNDRLAVEGETVLLAIERRDNPAIIGQFEFGFTDHTHFLAGFQVRLSKTLMTDELFREACSLLFVLCFGALNLHRLVIHVAGDGDGLSQQLLAVGMKQEAAFRQDRWVQGRWEDTQVFAFLREDYEQRVAAGK
ncbi:MAG: GNAT family N-acetyltransferase [Verrucomicrobiales bacterium]|nr:GNAT family N-acetyltransferase [Verrucomicrobiales bacterium]